MAGLPSIVLIFGDIFVVEKFKGGGVISLVFLAPGPFLPTIFVYGPLPNWGIPPQNQIKINKSFYLVHDKFEAGPNTLGSHILGWVQGLYFICIIYL